MPFVLLDYQQILPGLIIGRRDVPSERKLGELGK
jgi:hypothetical protein